MCSIKKIVPPIGVLVLMFSSVANAADMGRYSPSTSPLLQSAPLLVDEFSSGWYLRGDIGYRFNNDVDSVISVDPPGVRDHDLGENWMFGAGVGYKFEWFRTDFTVDYAKKADFSADSTVRPNDFTAKIDSATGLMNVYGDLGTWAGLTPYIGAGIGFAYVHADNFGVVSDGRSRHANSPGSWSFAWAYMAGVSYRVMGNLHIDAGYRHLNMGEAATGRITDAKLTFKDISADEVRVGFRYTLD